LRFLERNKVAVEGIDSLQDIIQANDLRKVEVVALTIRFK